MMRTKYKQCFLPILTTPLQMHLSLNFLDICLLLKMLKHLSELLLYFSSLNTCFEKLILICGEVIIFYASTILRQ